MPHSSRMRIALLGATFETSNLGVSALTAGALTCLRRALPEAEPYLLDYGREERRYALRLGDQDLEVSLVNLRFSKRFWLSNNVAWLIGLALLLRLLPFGVVRRALLRRNRWLRQIEETQVFAAISGGDSFSDIYGLGRLAYVALPQILVLLLHKPLILLPQTLGPYHSRTAGAVAGFVLRRAQAVYARDQAGVELGKQLVGPAREGRVRFCPDVAFALAPRPSARIEIEGLVRDPERRPLVGVNVSGLLAIGGYTRNNAFGLTVDYNRLMESLIELFINGKHADVLLVPHVLGHHEESDITACEQLWQQARKKFPGRVGIARGGYDQHEVKYLIGTCDFFIGARMHACIAALSQAVPAMAIAYSDKFRGVMRTLGVDMVVADARRLSLEQILALVDQTFENRAAVQALLSRNLAGVQSRIVEEFRRTLEQLLFECGKNNSRQPGSSGKTVVLHGQ